MNRNISFFCLGDFDLLVDENGIGYIIYSSNSMNVEQLTENFYYTANVSRYVFPENFVEAPVLMKRHGYYYALYSWCCCYCLQGSGVMVYRATSPLGPYTQQVNLEFCCESFV
jgi:beta-xylosidase